MKKLIVLFLAAFILTMTACDPSGGAARDLFVDVSGGTDAEDNVVLTWKNAETLNQEVAAYAVYRSDSADGPFEPVSPPLSASISAGEAKLGPVLYDLKLGETYYFKLKAEKSMERELNVDNPYSEVIKITMRSADIFPVLSSCFAQPSSTEDKVCLRWFIEAKPTYSDIAKLEVYRKTGDGAYSVIKTPIDSAKEYYDATVAEGKTYTYKIRVTYEDAYTASTKTFYESEERTITYSRVTPPDVTIVEPQLTAITVDTSALNSACKITFDCSKNNTSGDFGAEMRFINSSGTSTILTTRPGEFGNTSPIVVNVDSTYLENDTYALWTRVFVEYGGERTYSDYIYKYGIVVD